MEKSHDIALSLSSLKMLEELRLTIAAHQHELVGQLRDAGATWQAIGDTLGITLQGARSRFAEPPKRPRL